MRRSRFSRRERCVAAVGRTVRVGIQAVQSQVLHLASREEPEWDPRPEVLSCAGRAILNGWTQEGLDRLGRLADRGRGVLGRGTQGRTQHAPESPLLTCSLPSHHGNVHKNPVDRDRPYPTSRIRRAGKRTVLTWPVRWVQVTGDPMDHVRLDSLDQVCLDQPARAARKGGTDRTSPVRRSRLDDRPSRADLRRRRRAPGRTLLGREDTPGRSHTS
jgi:hypothetical protein